MSSLCQFKKKPDQKSFNKDAMVIFAGLVKYE